jgi:ActR/RegA family two-component response regulator
MLGAAGAKVDAVAGLTEARTALATSEYDAAVVDLRLTDGSGADLVPELRELGIRSVVLTGAGPVAVAGADQVLGKPVDAAVLVAAVTGAPPA